MMRNGSIVDRASPKALLTKYGRNNLEEVFLDIARGHTENGEAQMGDSPVTGSVQRSYFSVRRVAAMVLRYFYLCVALLLV